MQTESQSALILRYMQEVGPISPIEALSMFGCFRLGARCHDLRKSGHNIKSEPLKLANGKVVAQYSFVPPEAG